MTFWERVKSALSENDLTEADLSRELNLTQASITGWKVKGSIPRADIACKTAKLLNTSVEYLIDGKQQIITNGESNYIVPILNQELSAGKGDLLPDSDFIKGLISVPSYLREYGENLAGLFVHGDSMQPTLNNGDLVICTSLGWDNEEGLYAIRLNGNGYIKRIQVGAGKIYISSDNPKYKTIEESIDSECLEIIGKVVLIIKKA